MGVALLLPDSLERANVARALVHPELPALAWTNRVAIVERGLSSMSFGRFEVVDRTSRVSNLVEAMRRLVGA